MRCSTKVWWCWPLLVVMLLGGCNKETKEEQALQVFFTCDLYGRLKPCGCFDGQHGGLARMSYYMAQKAGPSALMLDVGNAAQGSEDYHLLQYEQVLQGFKDRGFLASNPGPREIGFGLDALRGAQEETGMTLVSANLVDGKTGDPVFPPYISTEVGTYRVAIVGVTEPGEGVAGEGLRLLPMSQALDNVLPKAAEESDFVILLAFAKDAALAELADRFYEVDLMLGGDVAQPSQKLERINRSYLVKTTNQGRTLGLFEGIMSPDGSLKGTLGEGVLMQGVLPQDEVILALERRYQERLGEVELAIDDPNWRDEQAIPGVETTASYLGSAACAVCHQEAYTTWTKSAHAHAFDSLVAVKSQADPTCIECHSVGFGEPTGFARLSEDPRLMHVGCESCHGPGSEHVAQRKAGGEVTFRYRHIGAGDCLKCHHGEFSRPFTWDDWWPRVQH